MIIEDHARDDDSAVGALLHGHGYATAGWISYNRIMIPESEPELFRQAQALLCRPDATLPRLAAPRFERTSPVSGQTSRLLAARLTPARVASPPAGRGARPGGSPAGAGASRSAGS